MRTFTGAFGTLPNSPVRSDPCAEDCVQDSGILYALLDLGAEDQLLGHPKAGASWEGFVIAQILSIAGHRDAYFWGTHQGTELDLMLMRGGRRYGFEIKLSDAPTVTKSMRIALENLDLARLSIVYPGAMSYSLDERIEVVSIADLAVRLDGLA